MTEATSRYYRVMEALTHEEVAKYHGFIVGFIAGRIDQCYGSVPRKGAELLQTFWLMRQLSPITALELLPTVWIVPKPPPELRARRDLLDPSIDCGIRLSHAARPKPIDQDAGAISG